MRESIERVLARYGLLVLLDGLAVVASYGLALLLRFEWKVPPYYFAQFLDIVWALVIAYCAVNGAWGLYSRLWQYAGAQEVVDIVAAGGLTSSVIFVIEFLLYLQRHLPLSVVVAGGIFTTGAFVVIRYRQRLLVAVIGQLERVVGSPDRRRVLIVGAGEAGQLLAWQIQHHDHRHEYELVGFVDDDPRKQGLRLHGLRVLGSREEIPQLARQREVDLIIIAIHRISGPAFREILSICQQTEAQVKVLPDVLALLKQPNTLPPLRDVELRDLLGRREVSVEEEACRNLLRDKVVLVTGACGSIGSELCRQIARFEPKRLLMVDNNETGLYDMQLELEALAEGQVAYIIADVTDRDKMEALIAREGPQIIFHAAAYKHVPLMEAFPGEAVKTNVFGTQVVAEAAQAAGSEAFVFISTDKAVNPTSVMGATKRLAEMVVLDRLAGSKTRGMAVRFGNVLGSRGSVLPVFMEEIRHGGPVTVTHPEMRRYFMTTSEAVLLVLQAATMGEGGEVFLLDMGEPVRILDLARDLIRFHNLEPDRDVPIVFTGIRPGEKLFEEVLTAQEGAEVTSHKRVFVARLARSGDRGQLEDALDKLRAAADAGERDRVIAVLRRAVPSYASSLAPTEPHSA